MWLNTGRWWRVMKSCLPQIVYDKQRTQFRNLRPKFVEKSQFRFLEVNWNFRNFFRTRKMSYFWMFVENFVVDIVGTSECYWRDWARTAARALTSLWKKRSKSAAFRLRRRSRCIRRPDWWPGRARGRCGRSTWPLGWVRGNARWGFGFVSSRGWRRARWCASTRPGCTLGYPCRSIAAAAGSTYSKIWCIWLDELEIIRYTYKSTPNTFEIAWLKILIFGSLSVLLFNPFLSAVPPPEASSPCWCGDHAIALTAAIWSE